MQASSTASSDTWGLIFDCDGVILEVLPICKCKLRTRTTEAGKQSDTLARMSSCVCMQSESLHREAYNNVFKEFEVDYNWTPEYYGTVCTACFIASHSAVLVLLAL